MMNARDRGASMMPWWLFLVTGIAWLLISLIVLRFDITSIATVGVLLGVVFLMAAVNEFAIMGGQRSWRWLHGALGVLFAIGAIWAFVHPANAFYELAAILGFLLLLKGSVDITTAVMSKEVNDLWWLGLVVGILEILLAFWASQQYLGSLLRVRIRRELERFSSTSMSTSMMRRPSDWLASTRSKLSPSRSRRSTASRSMQSATSWCSIPIARC